MFRSKSGERDADFNAACRRNFCNKLGLTYVSCSPFRVPVARLAAAQAALEEEAVAAVKPVKKCNCLLVAAP